MSTIELLRAKLLQISKDFQYILNENKQLRKELEDLKDKNDLFTRNSEDLILTINNRLKRDEQSE